MGAGSPSGSDTDVSPLGIVQGHAYSILDTAEIDGVKLIQLRNPWGDETEWRGAWGDDSKEWTQKRKNAIYQHMRARGFAATEIGVDDGIFWISLTDFFLNFNDLYLCRFFDDEWQGIDYDGSWSVADQTAGGSTNHQSCGQNP